MNDKNPNLERDSLEGKNLEENSNSEENILEENNNLEENLPAMLILLIATPVAFILGGYWAGFPVLIVGLIVLVLSKRFKSKKGAE